jgi:hypothetical protein
MINRTYVVKLPSNQRQANYVDICVQATMGTRLAPVADPTTYPGATPPPGAGPGTNWIAACGNAAYYEVRGRTLRLDHLRGEGAAAGFVQRTNLGFHLSVAPYGDWSNMWFFALLAGAQLSQSLLEYVGGDTCGAGAIPATNLADPGYDTPQPVIRIYSLNEFSSLENGGLVLVNFDVMERKDEDFCHIGSP